MRKILTGIISLILACVLITGCGGNGKPENISDDIYEKAIEAITIFDSYKNGEINSEECFKELYGVDVESKLLEKKDGKWTYNGAEISDDDAEVYCGIVDLRINFPSPYLELNEEQINHLEEVTIEARNGLAEKINYKE